MSAEAAILEQCRLHPEGIPDQDLATKISHIPVNDRAQAINALLAGRKLQIFKDGDTIVYKLVNTTEASSFEVSRPRTCSCTRSSSRAETAGYGPKS
jgi:DNA-directed RNA polymerase III subunit RPC6